MAAPTYVNASTGSYDTGGAWAHTGHTAAAVGNLIIVQIIQDGVVGGVNVSSFTNMTGLDGGAPTTINSLIAGFNLGDPIAARMQVWLGRVSSTSGALIVNGTNTATDDVYVRLYEFTNCSTGTTKATVIENTTAGGYTSTAGTSDTVADAAVVTIGVDRLAINLVAIDDDNAMDAFTGMSGGTWTEPVAEFAESGGTDACLQLQIATMGSAGTIDGGSDAMAASDNWGVAGFALIGTTKTSMAPPPRIPIQRYR